MEAYTLNNMRLRIHRLLGAFGTQEGNGIMQEYLGDGMIMNTRCIGMPSPQQVEEQTDALAVWIWSLKDYIKERYAILGGNQADVETYINNCRYLPLCADIANGAKHGTLTQSRSGKFARIGRISIPIRGGLIIQQTRHDPDVDVKVMASGYDRPKVLVNSNQGKYLGSGEVILRNGMKEWDAFFRRYPQLVEPSPRASGSRST